MRHEKEEFSFKVRAEVRMPKDAKLTDIVGPCDKAICNKGATPYGICFRCQGKGKLDWADVCRNHYYDRVQTSRVHNPIQKIAESMPHDDEEVEVEDMAVSDDYMFDM